MFRCGGERLLLWPGSSNGQSYTKFNYVENRALRLVDPTGYAATGDDTGGTGGDDDGYPDGEYDDGDGDDTTGGEEPEPVRPHVLWSWTGPTAVNGDGQGGPPADMPPSDDGVGCSGTACILAVLSTQPVTSKWTREFHGQVTGDLYAMGGRWAHGVAIAMSVVEAVLVAGELASGMAVSRAAKSGLRPMARSLGAAGDHLLLKKAVNSNLPHAIAEGIERKVFANPEAAGAALRGPTLQISKTGTFPTGTLVDTARTGRFLVPVGDNGMAVYQLVKNGTARLKTVLIAR